MSFGSGKKKADEASKKAAAALQPRFLSSDFGNIAKNKYTATGPAYQRGAVDAAGQGLYGALQSFNPTYDVNQAYNNPFYDTLNSLYQAPIDRQKGIDDKDLSAKLAATNQSGGSYDAYARNLMAQRYDTLRNQASQQARLGSADAYNQQFSNNLNAIAGLGNAYSQSLENYYAPAKLAMNYQQSIAPLQQAQANVYNQQAQRYASQPGFFGSFLPSLGSSLGNTLGGGNLGALASLGF